MTDLSKLPLEHLMLLQANIHDGIPWITSANPTGIALVSGVTVKLKDAQKALRLLARDGLLKRERVKIGDTYLQLDQQTVTYYGITESGRKHLKELGLL